MDQRKERPIESIKIEAKILKRGMIDAHSMGRWSEYTESAINPVLVLLDERMKRLDINASTVGGLVGVGITDM